ncbi:MAG: hypothetical protein R3B09_23775 [Nannocystaceae bacterium]
MGAIAAAAATRRHLVLVGDAGAGYRMLAEHYHRGLGGRGARTYGRADQRPPRRIPPGVVVLHSLVDALDYVQSPWREALVDRRDVRVCLLFERDESATDGPILDLGEPHAVVEVPGLDARREEIPLLVRDAVAASHSALSIDVTLIEACLLQGWPGGIPALRADVREAVNDARAGERMVVKAKHLRSWSPLYHRMGHEGRRPERLRHRARRPPQLLADTREFTAVLRACDGDVARAAAHLGVPEEAVEQWIRRHKLGNDPSE